MKKKSGVCNSVGSVCNQSGSSVLYSCFSVANRQSKHAEDTTSHALGRNVPPVGTTSPNGWDNNRFGRVLYHLPQAHQDRYTLI